MGQISISGTLLTPTAQMTDDTSSSSAPVLNGSSLVNDDSYSISIFEVPLIVSSAAGVLSNDVDPSGGSLTAALGIEPQGGIVQLNGNGSFIYTPNPGFIGVDSFTYIATNDASFSETAEVTVEVKFLPDPTADAMFGSSTPELLRGESTSDYILGLGGNDIIIGRTGDDTLGGGSGDDVILGRAGFELIDGGAGNDILDGGRGDDAVFGGVGEDHLKGQRGNDLLLGGKGDDEVQGHSGSDTLFGGDGDDTLRGGSEADIFVLAPQSGVDRLGDMTLGEDVIALSEGLTFNALSFGAVGNITTISVGGTVIAEVRLEGSGTLEDASNFIIF